MIMHIQNFSIFFFFNFIDHLGVNTLNEVDY